MSDLGAGAEASADWDVMFSSAQRLAGIGSWVWDVAEDRVTWSQETYRILGLAPEEFDGTLDGFLRHVHPDDRAPLLHSIDRAFAGDRRYSYQYRLTGRDGRERLIAGDGEAQFEGRRLKRLVGIVMDMTERERERRALRESEARLRQSNDSLRMAMHVGRLGAWSIDLPGRTIHWADGGRVIFNPEGGVAGHLDEVLARVERSSRDELQSEIDACAAHGRRFELEVPLMTCAHPALWVRLIGEPLRTADGQIRGLHGTLQDITERKLAAERVRDIGSRLADTLDRVPECLVTVNRDWCFTYLNQEAERTLRHSRHQLLGRSLWDEFPGLADSLFGRQCRQAAERQKTEEFDGFVDALGQWLHVKAHPSPRGLAIYFRDITDSHAVQDALAESQEQLRNLFENTIDGVIYTAADDRIVRVNAAACAMLGRTIEQLRGMQFSALVAQGDGRFEALCGRRAAAGRASGQLALRRADGVPFEADVSSAEYQGSGDSPAFVVFRDISDRLRADNEIRALNTELGERVRQRTAELEAANDELKAFARSLAHDLRAPIAAIDGFGEMLERSLGDGLGERPRHFLRRIRAAADKMDRYTDGLLSLARVSQAELRIETVDLGAIAADVLAQLHENERARAVEWSLAPELMAQGDPTLLRMVMENLLGNAWKFTGKREQASIVVSGEQLADGTLLCAVQDNGAGFDMAYADKLFGSFQRLHPETEFSGTGIGLANVQRIVTRHGGRVWAEAAPGQGACFRFTLPAAAPAPA